MFEEFLNPEYVEGCFNKGRVRIAVCPEGEVGGGGTFRCVQVRRIIDKQRVRCQNNEKKGPVANVKHEGMLSNTKGIKL